MIVLLWLCLAIAGVCGIPAPSKLEARVNFDQTTCVLQNLWWAWVPYSKCDITELRDHPRLHNNSPVRRFIKTCDLDVHWPSWDYNPFYPDWFDTPENRSEPVFMKGKAEGHGCEMIPHDILDMSETEANLWFCFGERTRRTLLSERNLLSFLPGIYNHKQLCEEAYPEDASPTFYAENQEEVERYKKDIEKWKESPEYSYETSPPFNWTAFKEEEQRKELGKIEEISMKTEEKGRKEQAEIAENFMKEQAEKEEEARKEQAKKEEEAMKEEAERVEQEEKAKAT